MGNPTQRQKTGRAQIWVKEALLFHQKYKVELDLLTDPHQADSNPNVSKGLCGPVWHQQSKVN